MPDERGYVISDAFVHDFGLKAPPPVPGQAYRPGGTTFHGRGLARDYGMLESDAVKISQLFAPLAMARPDLIPEMFGADGVGFDEGHPYQEPGHTDHHTHVAIGSGVRLAQLFAAHPHKIPPPDPWAASFVPVLIR